MWFIACSNEPLQSLSLALPAPRPELVTRPRCTMEPSMLTVVPSSSPASASALRPSATAQFAGLTFKSALARLAEHWRRQRAIAQLQALDDRMLRDIGLPRCEIWYRVNQPRA
jgi:uncharacterized protein YjiS (DUF1127 family)